MSLNLSQATADYLMNWEGHNDLEDFSAEVLVKIIKASTTQEIQDEFNRLSTQTLWNDGLTDLFYEELIKRIMDEPTFLISTNWFNLDGWLEIPFMTFQVGFNDSYSLVDRNGTRISLAKVGLSSFTLTSDDLASIFNEELIKLIIRNHANNLVARVQVDPEQPTQIQVVAIINQDHPRDYLNFLKNGQYNSTPIEDWSSSPTAQTIDVPLQVAETMDFLIIRRMINALQGKTYGIVDPDEDRLMISLDRDEQKLKKRDQRRQDIDRMGIYEVQADDFDQDKSPFEYDLEE